MFILNFADVGYHSFVVGFLHSTFNPKNPIHIYVYSPRAAFVTVSAPLLGFRRKTFVSGSTEIIVKGMTPTPHHTGVYPFGFVVESTEPIRAYTEKVDMDGLIPEKKLSTDYVLMSWYNDVVDYEALFGIVGTVNDTKVTIRLNNGTVWKQVLNRYELFQYGSNMDVSGSFISASQNIAVVTGHKCTNAGPHHCDHLFNMMPPIQQFQRQFIVSFPVPGRPFKVRIVAVLHHTRVQLSNVMSTTLHKGELAWYKFKHTAISITSSNPIMVAAYALSSLSEPAFDPAQLIVPGVSLFKPFYGFYVPRDVIRAVLTITFPVYKNPFPCLKLNGRTIVPDRPVYVHAPGRGQYMVFNMQVFPGEISVYTTEGTAFGAYLLITKPHAESWFSLPYSG